MIQQLKEEKSKANSKKDINQNYEKKEIETHEATLRRLAKQK